MEAYRIRIVHSDRSNIAGGYGVTLDDYSFSQMIEIMQPMSEGQKENFREGKSVILPNGDNVKFIKQV